MKHLIVILLIVILLSIVSFYLLRVFEDDSRNTLFIDNYIYYGSCNSIDDCEMDSCGCIAKNATLIRNCQKSPWIINYTVECGCENSMCVDIMIPMERPAAKYCKGESRCFFGTVTEVIDGDTLKVDNETVRLALVNAPELGEEGYDEAKEYVYDSCVIGRTAVVDQDDNQTEGSYGRLVGKVYCVNHISLNEGLANRNLVTIDERFCEVSEFADEEWTGCNV